MTDRLAKSSRQIRRHRNWATSNKMKEPPHLPLPTIFPLCILALLRTGYRLCEGPCVGAQQRGEQPRPRGSVGTRSPLLQPHSGLAWPLLPRHAPTSGSLEPTLAGTRGLLEGFLHALAGREAVSPAFPPRFHPKRDLLASCRAVPAWSRGRFRITALSGAGSPNQGRWMLPCTPGAGKPKEGMLTPTGLDREPFATGFLQGLGQVSASGFRLNPRKNFFPLRVTEPWPRLPREAVESRSLEIFQPRLAAVLCPLLWVTLLGQGVGLGDPQRALPTPNIL